jgi:hypothetical protein
MKIKSGQDNVVVFNMNPDYNENQVTARSVYVDIAPSGEERISRYYRPDCETYTNKYDATEHVLEFTNAVSRAHLIAHHIFSRKNNA